MHAGTDAAQQPAGQFAWDRRFVTKIGRPTPPGAYNPRWSRRDLLAALLSAGALPLLSVCAPSRGPRPSMPMPATPGDAQARALLDQIAEDLLLLFPEAATSLGIDTGSRSGPRSALARRPAKGLQGL